MTEHAFACGLDLKPKWQPVCPMRHHCAMQAQAALYACSVCVGTRRAAQGFAFVKHTCTRLLRHRRAMQGSPLPSKHTCARLQPANVRQPSAAQNGPNGIAQRVGGERRRRQRETLARTQHKGEREGERGRKRGEGREEREKEHFFFRARPTTKDQDPRPSLPRRMPELVPLS